MSTRIFRALSVRQPWAGLIASGRKTIETRTWATKYRGELLIVSSKRPPIEPAGCTVALADLVDCRPMSADDEAAACCEVYPGAFAWVLGNIRTVAPVPVKGALGIFRTEVDEADLRAD